MMSAMLKLSGVFKRFGALLAIDNLSMHLDKGEVLGVIGPNGSGKTTMFNILTGLAKADQGRVLFEGTDVTHLQAFERCRRGIARSFQIPRPFTGMSVFENLLVGATFAQRKPERAVHNRCVQVLEETGLLAKSNVLAALLAVADRLTVFNFGKRIADGEPRTVMASRAVKEIYLGREEDAI
jgi:branched-chain amino acid transport system ATP-binding protein